MKEIPLTLGKVALLDNGDYESLKIFKWSAMQCANKYYAVRSERILENKSILILMHRMILGLKPGDGIQIDHANGNGLHNYRSNLRICTQKQNCFNRIPNIGYAKFKGVGLTKRGKKWRARIKIDKIDYHLGVFDDQIDAAKAYDIAAKKYFGAFAWLNFPEEKVTING